MRLIPGTRIPQRIIHCWGWKPGNTEVLPPRLAQFRATWQHLNPRAQHLLLTKWAFERDVLPLYPRLQRVYEAWPHWIQRVDMARFLAVYHYGGVYADTDATCLVPLQRWVQHHPPLQGAACVFARDTRRSPTILVPDNHTMRPMSAQSGTFGAAQHHPLLLELLHSFQPRAQRPDEAFSRYVLNTTGPAWLTTTLAALWQHPAMVDGHVYVSREPIFGDTTPPQPGWLAAHHYTGLWRTPNKPDKTKPQTVVAAGVPPSSTPHSSREAFSTTPHAARNPFLTPRVVLTAFLILAAALLCMYSVTAVLWKRPRQGVAQGSRRILAR